MDVRRISTIALALALPACFSPNEALDSTESDTDPGGTTTTAAGSESGTPNGESTGTTTLESTTGSTTLDETTTGDGMDDSSTSDDPSTTGEPDPMAVCGDGMVEGEEDCDDAELNGVSGMSDCLEDCTLTTCGDGFPGLPETEECDQGDDNADDAACTADCAVAVCGDELVGPGESCDDGKEGSELCTPGCVLASCGDGIIQAGEDCDDENETSTDACVNCVFASCGDGFVEAGEEQCDDGAGNASEPIVCAYGVMDDDCTYCAASSCSVEQGITSFCGDGEIQAGSGEDCDDGTGNTSTAPTCAYGVEEADCTYCDATSCSTEVGNTSYCGDGVLQAGEGEACDDGDNVEGNGCNTNCVASGTVLWTHQFITSSDDYLDDPYFKSNSDVVVHLLNASTNQARTLSGATGTVVENRNLADDTAEIQPWGVADGYITRRNTSINPGFSGDTIVSRFSESGTEQWTRVFPGELSPRMSVQPGNAVALTAKVGGGLTGEGDRVVRVLDGFGNEDWDLATPESVTGYSAVLSLSNGTTVLSSQETFASPIVIQGYNEGGGGFWTLESGAPQLRAALSAGRWLGLADGGTMLQVRLPDGSLDIESPLGDVHADFAAQAPNGDIVVAGTGSTDEPSSVTRFTSELELLWTVSPTADTLPFFEVTGLAVGPENDVLITAEVFVSAAQEADGWAILLAP